MPDQNQNNQQSAPVFPGSDLPPLPPEFQNVPAQPTPASAPSSDVNQGGSPTSPPPSTPPTITTPKKKYGTGRIIATILGILLLVGGIGAGIVLTQQQQLFQQKAAEISCKSIDNPKDCKNACSPPKNNGKSYQCKWLSAQANCAESANECGAGGGGETEKITPGNCSGDQTKDNGWFQCGSGAGGANCNFCLYAVQRTCNQVLQDKGCFTATAGACNISGPVETYYCQGNPPPDTSGGCQKNDPLPAGVKWDPSTKTITGSFCGTVQVDQVGSEGSGPKGGPIFCTKTDTSGCKTQPPPTPTPASITASCLNVKGYDATWKELTTAQLSGLKAGDKVSFCVAGSTTGGTFGKAQFKVNSQVFPETTTKRPGSGDFCQSYTIPEGTTTFNVLAKIYHATLGWLGSSF